jgi:predicted Zn-dependent peptidase
MAGAIGANCASLDDSKPSVDTRMLANGLRVVAVHFPASTNVSIFSFVPLGLATDEANQAQWSHLVEHLVIRSTISQDSSEANAETLPDHMRLDFYGTVANWKLGLTHHRQWLEGKPFTEPSMAAEKPKVKAECDFTARSFATHKFAVAAWSQAYRHGVTNVALKGDVDRATLSALQNLRDTRFAVSNHVTLCIVGGIEPTNVFAEAQHVFGALSFKGTLPPSVKKTYRGLDVGWDLDARHLLMAWPAPEFSHADYPALMVAALLLNQSLMMNASVQKDVGMIFAGADLSLPEGKFFYVSASLKQDATFEKMRAGILDGVHKLAAGLNEVSQASLVAGFLSKQFLEIPSLSDLKAQLPPGMELSMVEMNIGLQFGMNEHRYGNDRVALAHKIAQVKPDDVARVVAKYLADDKALPSAIQPAKP